MAGERRGSWRRRWGAFSVARGVQVLVMVAVVAVLAVMAAQQWGGGRSTGADDDGDGADVAALRRESERALEAEDWARLVKVSRRLARVSPDTPYGWARLGYGLHRLEKWKDALAAYRRCCDFPQTRPWALYQMALVSAQLGRDDEAIGFLRDAMTLGHQPKVPIPDEPAFARLAKNQRFLEVVALVESLSRKPAAEQLRFLAGRWTVLDANQNVVGSATFEIAANGLAWRGVFQQEGGDTTALMYYYDPEAKQWERIRIGHDGTVERSSGRVRRPSGNRSLDLGELRLEGKRVGIDGTSKPIRVRLIRQSLEEVVERVDVSNDGGARWTTDAVWTYRRPTSLTSHL